MSKRTLKKFTVMAKLDVLVTLEIDAPNIEAALTKARTLTSEDFVEVHGDLIDLERTITGVYE